MRTTTSCSDAIASHIAIAHLWDCPR